MRAYLWMPLRSSVASLPFLEKILRLTVLLVRSTCISQYSAHGSVMIQGLVCYSITIS